jgi:hypothetical protein
MQLHSFSSFAPPSFLYTFTHKTSHAQPCSRHGEKHPPPKIKTANYTKAHPQGPGVHTVWKPIFMLH